MGWAPFSYGKVLNFCTRLIGSQLLQLRYQASLPRILNMTSALASLTATYTDSEGEEEPNEDHTSNEGTASAKTPSGSPSEKSNISSHPGSPTLVKVTSKVAKLVSYHDDTVVSDDEGDLEVPHQVVMIPEDKKIEEFELVEDDGITIPPEPPGHCSKELQEKIQKLHDKMSTQQMDMNAVIHKRKDFRNPSIYEKLITFCDLNELGKYIGFHKNLHYTLQKILSCYRCALYSYSAWSDFER